jgi:hypothetical protein
VGPEFGLEGRYAQVLTTLFVTLLFAGAMPVLLPFAALALALSFCVDKLAFFRYYCLPFPVPRIPSVAMLDHIECPFVP